jgi:hypothetical protein
MKYYRIADVWALALSLLLCAFALGGCELFAEDPPQLVIKNASLGPIICIEFWEETPELEEIGNRGAEAFIKQFTDPDNFLIHMAELWAVAFEYGVAAGSVAETTPPFIKDETVIPAGSSRSWDLETERSYIVRVNNVEIYPASMNRGSMDTVYVFDGENLSEKK